MAKQLNKNLLSEIEKKHGNIIDIQANPSIINDIIKLHEKNKGQLSDEPKEHSKNHSKDYVDGPYTKTIQTHDKWWPSTKTKGDLIKTPSDLDKLIENKIEKFINKKNM
ncbi:hypothetical protein [Flavobacterium sp.]|uniref:hypothetical protein n=1 Tax=Flavobacterium sp. TaxID=239 RepID=UPI0039E716AE